MIDFRSIDSGHTTIGRRFFHLNLRRLIILLGFFSSFIMLGNAFYASWNVQRDLLVDLTLEANQVYAAKLASSTELFLANRQSELRYSALLMAHLMNNPTRLNEEAARLWQQNPTFNSVIVANHEGRVMSVFPEQGNEGLIGDILDTPGGLGALEERRPMVSNPYISKNDQLVVFFSSPIVGKAGEYLGFVGGVISLREKNSLYMLMGTHYYRDGSYLYVVDESRRIIYHPDQSRLGDVVPNNAAIEAVLRGKSGNMALTNSQGRDMLAGFAPIPGLNWGVVAQRPVEATLAPLKDLMWNVFLKILPWGLLSLLLVWWLSRWIAKPLSQLADGAKNMAIPAAADSIRDVESWYFEAGQLKRALLVGMSLLQQKIGQLSHEAETDPLTGLSNRRGLEQTLKLWMMEQRAFCVLALDLDHFKRVNDTWGHDVGDEVLKGLATVMRQNARPSDFLCRSGGEEFLILLPDSNVEVAVRIGERLRRKVAKTHLGGISITLSVGVAVWPDDGEDPDSVFKAADDALYQAKERGRNQVVYLGDLPHNLENIEENQKD